MRRSYVPLNAASVSPSHRPGKCRQNKVEKEMIKMTAREILHEMVGEFFCI